jgi:hypothetical protein
VVERPNESRLGEIGAMVWPCGRFPALTSGGGRAPLPFLTSLPDGVMVAQATLTRLVMVRIHVGQPIGSETRTHFGPRQNRG